MKFNPLSNILIAQNVITPQGIKDIKEHIKRSESVDLSVFDPDNSNESGSVKWKTDKTVRDTQTVPLDGIEENIFRLMKNIVSSIINPFYEFEVFDSEIPQLLSYDVGGHYKAHIDGESLWKTPDGDLVFKKSVDRDLSLVLFLNNDFEGGDLVFPDLKIRIRPEPGLLVCFPSSHMYLHGVEPVTKGKRYSMVTWARIKGFPTLEEVNKIFSEKYGVSVTI